MRKIKISATLFLTAFFASTTTFAQIILSENDKMQKNILTVRAEKRLDLVADLDKISKLKIYLRKNEFSLDEMMNLDVAVLARADVNYYFPADLDVNIIIKDKSGSSISGLPFVIKDSFQSSFKRTKDALIFKSFQLILGCQEEKYKIPSEFLGSEDNKILFDNNVLRTLGDGCIDIKKAEELEIYAELTNNLVVIQKDKENTKTAVGTVKSNSLKILVKE